MSDKIIHIHDEDSEADTCRKEVLPKLYESKWSDDLILEQRTFTDGKIIVIERKAPDATRLYTNRNPIAP